MNSPIADSESASMRRLRRISRGMELACWLLLVVLPLALAYYWTMAGEAELAAHARLSPQAVQGPITGWQRTASGVVMAIPLGLLLAGVWQARRCFAMFARGQVFTRQATVLLGRFAGWVAWAALASMLAGGVGSVLLTWHNPPGQRQLALGISSDHVFTLFFAGTVWLLAAVIAQGRSLAEENEGFV